MTNVNRTSSEQKIVPREMTEFNKNNNVEIEDIEFLFSTEKLEDERSDFDATFEQLNVYQKSVGGDVEQDTVNEQAQKFYKGLVDNKQTLCSELGISEEKYDSLACVALALASQETGMGAEDGYQQENTGFGKVKRAVMKFVDVLTGGLSASSGLTQMKIYEFLNDDQLPDDKKQILKDHGIKAKKFVTNNLFEYPDKSAIATVVVLSELSEKYDDYKQVIKDNHLEIAESISNNPQELKNAEQSGDKILTLIFNGFKNLSVEDQKELRTSFKQVLLSSNGTKIGDDVDNDYNEEVQINKLNNLLKDYGIDVEFDSSSLNNVRYALTNSENEMNETEYIAYAWNKGTGETGLQLDRMLAAKVGTILSSQDSFDEDQFESNVSVLTEKYANQSVGEDGLSFINDYLA